MSHWVSEFRLPPSYLLPMNKTNVSAVFHLLVFVNFLLVNLNKDRFAGDVSTFAGTGSTANVDGLFLSASFENPCGLAVDSTGTIFVSQLGSSQAPALRMLSTTGTQHMTGLNRLCVINNPK